MSDWMGTQHNQQFPLQNQGFLASRDLKVDRCQSDLLCYVKTIIEAGFILGRIL